jgi:uncharacterized membrane protein
MNRKVAGSLAGIVIVTALGAAARGIFGRGDGERRESSQGSRLMPPVSPASSEDVASSRGVRAWARAARAAAAGRFQRVRSSDGNLLRQVRDAISGAVTHPSMIGLSVEEGRVLLHGDVLAEEHDSLVRSIQSVRGVTGLVDHLRQRTPTDRLWALERPLTLQSARLDFHSEHWSPPTRVLGGAAGLALLGAAVRDRRSLLAPSAGVWGLWLLVRSLTNRRLGQLGPQHGVFEVSAATDIQVPVERVFRVVSAWDRFPTFMHNVRSVTRYDDGTSHWAVGGRGGVLIEWDSVITAHRAKELLAWRTLPGSRIEHCGVVRFDALGADRTRVRVHMSYKPPGGALGHLAARACGMDAGRTLEEALARLKHFIEDWDMVGQGGVSAAARTAEVDGSLRATP